MEKAGIQISLQHREWFGYHKIIRPERWESQRSVIFHVKRVKWPFCTTMGALNTE